MECDWKLDVEATKLIDQIVCRAEELGLINNRLTLTMDLTVCHNLGCRLDLKGLAEASMGDFGHDIMGIQRHLNRNTGQLMDCFVPRYASRGEWTVVEHAGCANERTVSTCASYDDALTAKDELYTESEQEELGVDILKNGSTEY